MRIVFDIDGVIATGDENAVYSNKAKWAYENCDVVNGARAFLQKLVQEGHYIILYSARWKRDKVKTHEWLEINAIPFHELHIGKPSASLYVDDRGYKFDGNWNKLKKHIDEVSKASLMNETLLN